MDILYFYHAWDMKSWWKSLSFLLFLPTKVQIKKRLNNNFWQVHLEKKRVDLQNVLFVFQAQEDFLSNQEKMQKVITRCRKVSPLITNSYLLKQMRETFLNFIIDNKNYTFKVLMSESNKKCFSFFVFVQLVPWCVLHPNVVYCTLYTNVVQRHVFCNL